MCTLRFALIAIKIETDIEIEIDMNKLSYLLYFVSFILVTGCVGSSKIVSTTNQAPSERKTVMESTTMTETRPDGTVVVTEKIIYTDADGKKTTAINIKEAPVSPPKQSENEPAETTTPTVTTPTVKVPETPIVQADNIVEIQGKKYTRNPDGTLTAIEGNIPTPPTVKVPDTPIVQADNIVEIQGKKYTRNPDGTLTAIEGNIPTPPTVKVPDTPVLQADNIVEIQGKKYTRNPDGTLTAIEESIPTPPTVKVPDTPVVEVPAPPAVAVETPTITTPDTTVETPPAPTAASGIDTAREANYMTEREKNMIKEINLVRSDPTGYIPLVNEYREQVKRTTFTDANFAKEELRAIEDLIRELQLMSPIAILQPRETLHNTAKAHGNEMKARNKTGHVGNDNSYPWDRITRDDPSLEDGNENLVGGPDEVRKSVMLLLVDSGIPGYGHRKTLLNPTWKYVSCYEVGEVQGFPHYWVQNFAK